MGFPASTDDEIAESLNTLLDEPWQRRLPSVLVVRADETLQIPIIVSENDSGQTLTLKIQEESGEKHTVFVDLASAGVVAERETAFGRRMRVDVTIPGPLPLGYHRAYCETAPDESMSLIVAPRQAYLPSHLENGGKLWGISTQLYALKRDKGWGIGDFQDLDELMEAANSLGASVVGLNPLHMLFVRDPERASPYQPSSRMFLNPLYVDIARVPEFKEATARKKLGAMAASFADSPKEDSIAYAKVTESKWSALETLYDVFQSKHLAKNDKRAKAFKAFREREGHPLHRFALFEALSEKFQPLPWQEWPEVYQNPESPDVAKFDQQNESRVTFYCYLQWIADEQLREATERTGDKSLAIGLYRDLAIESAYDGSDAWGGQSVFALNASTGCPPDPFNMLGQDWEIPPFNPHALRRSGYELFIAVIRANMRHAGALRIDHVMGLMHLFWVPKGDTPANGAYVKYPFEDLLAIVALESHRNQCLVIGEDLGTVPPGFRERMADANMLSYRVLYFEKDGDRFKSPGEYPKLALACVTTHDLATLEGFWQDLDIDLKHDLSLYPSADAELGERQGRQNDRHLLLRALENEGLLPDNRDPNQADATGMDEALNVAIHRYVAQSPASIVLIQIDDLMRESEQINLPGTVDERPNWRRRLSHSTTDLVKMPLVRALRDALSDREGSATS
jgi:4-alpha-glucanotransferase